jgi:glucosamine--fructose-6-phosphate aminotransferase (isomerizing)
MVSIAGMIGSKKDFSALSYERFISELKSIPSKVEKITSDISKIKDISKIYSKYDNMLFIGRGMNEMVAKEAALKVKEISYIHAEGYSAAELKHGPLALITPDMPTVAIVQSGPMEEKMISNIREVKARGGIVIGIVEDSCSKELKNILDNIIEVPSCLNESLKPMVFLVPCQLLAYYLAVHRGCDVDMPRNLAKSVSVE